MRFATNWGRTSGFGLTQKALVEAYGAYRRKRK